MSAYKVFIPSLLVMALAACAVGPDYRAPVTAPAKLASAAQGSYDRSKVDRAWWQQFEDPTLNKLVARSLDGNRDLRVAFARLKSARDIRDDVANDVMPVVTSRASSDIGKGQQPGITERIGRLALRQGSEFESFVNLLGQVVLLLPRLAFKGFTPGKR